MKRRNINTWTETIEIKLLFKPMKYRKKINTQRQIEFVVTTIKIHGKSPTIQQSTCIRILHGWINQIKSRTLTVYSEILKLKKGNKLSRTRTQFQGIMFRCMFFFRALDRLVDGTRRRQQKQKQTFRVYFTMFYSIQCCKITVFISIFNHRVNWPDCCLFLPLIFATLVVLISFFILYGGLRTDSKECLSFFSFFPLFFMCLHHITHNYLRLFIKCIHKSSRKQS